MLRSQNAEEHHRQLKAIKRQDEFYQRIYDSVAEGVILQQISGLVSNANTAACVLLDTSLTDMQESEFPSQVTPWMNDQGEPFSWQTHASNVLASAQDSEGITHTLKRFAPAQRWLHLHSVLLRDAQGEPSWVVTTLSDISPRKYSELQETVLYGITQRILSEQPLRDIFQYLCDELVFSVGYPIAAVILKKAEGAVVIEAQAGVSQEYARTLNIRWDDSPEGKGAVGEAIRSGKPQAQNLIDNPQFEPWCTFYKELDLQSIATFPLWAHGQCLGVIALYTHLPDYFTSVRVERLQALVEQISMALLAHEDRSQLRIQSAALSAAGNAIILTDRSGKVLWANPAFAQLTGYTFEEAQGQNIRFLQSGYQDSTFYKRMWGTVLAGETWRGELINRHAKGTLFREEMTITPVLADGAEITHFIAIKQDVSETFAIHKALRDSEERYQEMFENMSNAVAIFQFSKDEKVFFCTAFNRAAEQMENLPRSQVLGQPLDRFFSNREWIGVLKIFFHVFRTGEASHFPATYYHNAYGSGWREGFIYKLSTCEVVAIYEDVSEKRALLHQLSHQAHHDALTGLPNRILFNDRAQQAIAQAHRHQTRIAVLFLDLDRFKLINDTLGHAMGDQLLRTTGERLVACLREGDTVSRLGGDEFLILLPEMGSEDQVAQVTQVAQKLMNVFKEPFQLQEKETYITVSLGIALYPTDGEDIENLIKHADTAMYHAKEAGRNRFQFYTLAFNEALSNSLII